MNEILKGDIDRILDEKIQWEKLKGQVVLITGASGMLGMYFLYVLCSLNDQHDYGIQIIAVLRNPSKLPKDLSERPDVTLLIHDVTEPFPELESVGYVIHAASPASPRIMQNQPVETIAANTLGTYYTLQLAAKLHARGYLFISSREIYGQPVNSDLFSEDTYGFVDPLTARSCYPEGKKAAETMCVSFREEYGLDAKIARLAHTYGPGMSVNDGRVQADFLRNVIQNENIVMKSDGSSVRTYTYVSDAVAGLFYVLLNADDVVYNIGDEEAITSIRGLAELLIGLVPESNLQLVMDIPQGGTKGTAPFTQGIVSSKKIRALGWTPRLTLAEGFHRTIAYLQDEAAKE